MSVRFLPIIVVLSWIAAVGSPATANDQTNWWNPKWKMRTTVTRTRPYRSDAPRPVEVAVDFPKLLERAGIGGRFNPRSLRVVERTADGVGRPVPFAYRTELDAALGREVAYLAWIAHPRIGEVGTVDVYFDTQNAFDAESYEADRLPPENLPVNPGFERQADGLPLAWTVEPAQLARLDKFAHSTGKQSLKIVVDENTPAGVDRRVVLSQKFDVRKYAGQEMVFECDLLAQRAVYGAPISIELRQFRADDSRILECAVEPRWLTIELAEGQLVQFRERGCFSHEAAAVELVVQLRCYVRDADTQKTLAGPESFFTVWLDRVVVRPGERWPWPAETGAGFVEGALERAPINRGFRFSGQRRLAFNGASEGTLTAGQYNPDPKSAHWGLQAGTLEFWCRPAWDAEDGKEHLFFEGVAYGHRLQSSLRKLDAGGNNALEFRIADAGCQTRTVRGPAPFRAGPWHHVAATWDFPKAHLQLFVDGKRVAGHGPGAEPWPSSLVPRSEKKEKGIGIMEDDARSMPMQAFIGGGRSCRPESAADAVIDEFRISDVVRYHDAFEPRREEFDVDGHTRALFHFECERDGLHGSDDRFVRGHLGCELPIQQEQAPLDILDGGKIERKMVTVKPHPSPDLFESNRAESRLTVTRPLRPLPDPRFTAYRGRQVERTVRETDDDFVLSVGGDFAPLMRWITFERADTSSAETTLLPRWRANDNVVPLSVESIAATLATGAKDDAEKALEAFKYALQVTNYYDAHYCESLPTRHRKRVSYTLTKALNIYPFDQCGPLNYTLRKLFLAVGISSNDASGTHHQFEQAFYGGRWRLFDLSPRIYWLNRDDVTVAGRRDFENDIHLKVRQGSGIASALRGRKSRARFGTAERPHCMDFPLRPGERASFCWHNEGRWFEITDQREPIPLAKIPPHFGNGAIVYEPVAEGDAARFDNMIVRQDGDARSVLHPKDPAKPASLVYRAECPYIFSDAMLAGSFTARAGDAVRVELSFDEGRHWEPIWSAPDRTGNIAVNLREQIAGRYAYWLRIQFVPDSAVEVTGLNLRNTFVASPLAGPGKLSRGENRIRFAGARPAVPLRTVCRWVERHSSNLGVSLDTISYYLNGDEAHRNLLVVVPAAKPSVRATLQGRPGRFDVSLEKMPEGWTNRPEQQTVEPGDPAALASVEFTLQPGDVKEGEIHAFEVVLRNQQDERRVPVQVLVADAPLVREAESADRITGNTKTIELGELSGARAVVMKESAKLAFDFSVRSGGTFALWMRARWESEADTSMAITVDGQPSRTLRAFGMIGFTDWTAPNRAHTKMFAHFGEQYEHWAWYRVPDIALAPGKHRLVLGASAGAWFDAFVFLPQNPVVDRAAMNLFQNWNYAPWQNPMKKYPTGE